MVTRYWQLFLIQNNLLHPNRLHIREFTNTVGAEFAANAGSFHSAKRNPGVREDHLIDKHHSRFQFIDEAFLLVLIVGPRARAETEPAVIGDTNRFVRIFHAENGGYRTKKFFAVSWRIFRNI